MATLTSLITRVRLKSDMQLRSGQSQADHRLTDADATQFIQDANEEVYRLLVKHDPDSYTTSTTFSTAAGTYEYALPADFYKLRGVERQEGTDNYVTVQRETWGNRNRKGLKYSVRGSNIRFMADPGGGDTYRVWYIPTPTALASGSDTYDGTAESEALVVVKAARMILDRDETDSSHLQVEEGRLTQEIMESAQDHDMEQPGTITDVTHDYDDAVWPGDWRRW